MTIGWLTALLGAITAVLGGAGLGGMLKTWLDHKRGMRKATDEVALTLVTKLERRVETVEASAAQERALCDAELRVLRHRINNLSGDFDGLLLLVEMAPDRAAVFVARIKEKRAHQAQAEATERAAVVSATITSAAPRPVPMHAPDERTEA